MLYLLKYLKGILLFRQVADDYRNETGKDKPALLSRRFINSLIASAGAGATLYTGVNIDAGLIAGIEEHISKIADAGYQIYVLIKSIFPSLIFLYGVLGIIIGYFKREKKAIQ